MASVKVVNGSNTKVVSCSCSHEYQDSKYGKGKRLANAAGGKGGSGYRCTVCAKSH